MKRRIHNQNQIDGDLAARQEGFGPAEDPKGLGTGAAGQSGDLQGLSHVADADSESVDELLEEGQFYEAAAVSGVEDAANADAGEVKTREVPEDDVPPEYLDRE
ncbi:MAG TPA: hypothetical protein VI455_03260 [Terriglobia bacterium]